MTLGVGWVDGKSVYLIADSVITYRDGSSRRSDESTFGEPQGEGDQRVEESAVKTIALTEEVAAVYAGNVTVAMNFLSVLGRELLKGRILIDILRDVRPGPGLPAGTSCHVLLGAVTADGPRLFRFDGVTCRFDEIYAPNDPVVIGSLPRDGVDLVKRLCTGPYALAMRAFAEDADRVLATVMGSLQAAAQRSRMIRDRAGGTFFGMRVDANGVQRQPDLWYVLYRDAELRADTPITHHVLVGMRENVAFSWSGRSNKRSYFVTEIRDISDGEIEARYGEEFRSVPAPSADYYFFIERDKGGMVGIECRGKPPSRYLVVTETENGPAISLTGELLQDLDEIRDCDPANVPLIMKSE